VSEAVRRARQESGRHRCRSARLCRCRGAPWAL